MSEPNADQQQARLAALYQVSSHLGASLDPNEVINQVMDAIMELTGAERAVMMLYDNSSGELQVRASRVKGADEALDAPSLQISRTVVERAIATGHAILTNNAQEDDRFSTQQSVVGLQLRSIMCSPLRIRGYTLGAVYVDNRLYSSVFADGDLDLLVAFANQAAVALDNARLFTQTDQALARRVEEMTLFQRIDQQLTKSLDLDRVMNLALEWALRLTNADGGTIGIIEQGAEDEEPMLRLLGHRRAAKPSQAKNGTARLVAPTHPLLRDVLDNGRAVMISDASESTTIDGTAVASQLAVPVKREGDVIGLITLESLTPNGLDKEDMAFVERLADRAAVAMKNAQLYEEIQAINKAKTDFVSLVTHELRLPLTSIKGYSDLLNSGMAGALNEQQTQFLEVIRRNLLRMSVLISDLSDINRVEAGRMQFENKSFDMRDVVEDTADNFREALAKKEQSLTVEMPDDLPPVYADAKRMSQVLNNLVSNAHKYTGENGRITIRVLVLPAALMVQVQDNGLGISVENQAKLFTQFFRAEDQAVRDQTGWGLGLSIVKKMVEAQGGEIGFESELGTGSTFLFTIPLAQE